MPPFENYNYNLDNYFIKCYTQYIVVKKLYLVCKELVTEVTSGKFESSFINFQNYKQYYDSNLIIYTHSMSAYLAYSYSTRLTKKRNWNRREDKKISRRI